MSTRADAAEDGDGAAELDAGEDGASDAPCPGCLLAPCESGSDCHSGLCVAGPDGLVCTRWCDGNCPVGYVCLAFRPGTDSGFICIYEHVSYCRDCVTDDDCGLWAPLARCVPLGADGGSVCASPCGVGGCPEGASCQALPGAAPGVDGCLPDSGACD